MPRVRDRPLSPRAQLAMHPFAQIKADHFLRALLDPAPVDSRKVWRLAGDFGISRSTLYKVARAQRVRFLTRGKRRQWAAFDWTARPLQGPPYHPCREALREAAGIASACAWDLWGILCRVLGPYCHVVRELLTRHKG